MYYNNIKYLLGIIDTTEKNIRYKFVSKSNDKFILPQITLDENLSDESIESIHNIVLSDILTIDTKYLEIRLLDIEKTKNIIDIYYLSHIPKNINIHNAFIFEPNKEIFLPIIQKAKRFL